MSTALSYACPIMSENDESRPSGSHLAQATTPAFQHGYPVPHAMYYPMPAAQVSYPPSVAYLPTPSGTPVLIYNEVACLPQQVSAPWQLAVHPQAHVVSQEDHHRPQQFDPQIRVPSDLGASVFYPDQTANPIVVAPPAIPAPQVAIVPSHGLPVHYGYTYAAPVYVQDAYPSQTSINTAAAPVAPATACDTNLCAAPGDVFGSAKEQPTFVHTPVECSSAPMESSASSGSFHGVMLPSACSSPAVASQIGSAIYLTVPTNSNLAPYSPALSTSSSACGGESARSHKLKRSHSDAEVPRQGKRKATDPVPTATHPDHDDDNDDDEDGDDEDEHNHADESAGKPETEGADAADADDGKPKKRSRTAQACERCRIRKARCFGGQPCNRCTKRGFVCEFAPTKAAVARSKDQTSSADSPTADSTLASPTMATTLPTVPLLKRKPGRPSLEGVATAAAAAAAATTGSHGTKAKATSNSYVSVLSQVRGAASTQVSPVQSRAPRPSMAARPRSHSSAAVPQSAGPLFALTGAGASGPVIVGPVPLASGSPAALFGHGMNGFISPTGLPIGLGLELPGALPAGGMSKAQAQHLGDLTLTSAPEDADLEVDLEFEDDLSLPGLVSGSCSSSISPFSGSNAAELAAHSAMTGPLSSSSLASSAWTALLDPTQDGGDAGADDNVFAFTAGYDLCGQQSQLGSGYALEPMYQEALDQLQGDTISMYTPHLTASPQLSYY